MSKKGFIILLVILAVLYIASLGMGVVLNSSEEVDLDALQKRAGGWIGRQMDAFADRLDLGGLQCGGASVADGFALKAGADENECTLDFEPGLDDDDEFVKTELRFTPLSTQEREKAGQPPTVYVNGCLPEDDDAVSSGADDAESEPVVETLRPYRLQVTYVPKGESADDPPCWLKRELPLSLTVTRGGGTLTLTLVCTNCGDGASREAKLRLK